MFNFLLPKKEEDLENKKNSNKKDDHMKHKNILASSRWSHLPFDLLGTIADRLYFLDEVRFRAVCKNWHCQATQHKTTLVKSLPWILKLIRPSIHRFEFQLYEPLTNFKPTTAFHKIDFSQFLSTHLVKHIKITCKHGCLLFQIPRNDWCSTTFVFFSLLSKRVVTLPRLGHNRSPHCFYITAFSAEPSSQDFVLIVLKPRGEQKHLISTFSRRENRWTSTMFAGVPFLCYGCIVVFIRGIFYFINRYGHMASYDITAGVWKQETVSMNHSITRSKVRNDVRYAFELYGQLMVVCLGSYGDSFRFCVRRFDWFKKVWIPVSSLGERAICVGFNSFSVKTVQENAPNCGVLPNMINVLVDPGCNVYTVENGGSLECINELVLANWNIARELSVEKELNFWFEPPDYFVNQKQPGTEMGFVGNEEVNVASTSNRGPVELATTNKKSTPDQTVEDDEVEENMKDLRQLKRLRGDPAEPAAAVKLCAIGYRGNWSHRISRHSGMQAITSLPTYTSFPRYMPAKNYENQRKKARYAFRWYHPDFGRIPEGSEAELIAAGWPLRMVEEAGEALKGWVPRKEKSFQKLEKIGEGIYSHVYRGFDLEQNIKVNKLEPESIRACFPPWSEVYRTSGTHAKFVS
ncbi:hypothetical protein POM88_008200 [Heracleum sosnowskyi]|uniref:KIB1-4 beta-propeller domain-containing protein n=1 Tax=Heracleum sosnowskyi TaxID=360622 RepID=A0AAD8J9F8_9APIA|nr:hypothetical protein POM88_008200 [Heracleum sosnowskyi]